MNEHAPVVLDIAGLALDDDDRRRLRHPLTGGLILFARNWQDRRQLTDLAAEIKSIRPDVLICVDHEGGRVQRFRTDGFTHLPPMRALGELWMQGAQGAMTATDAATAVGHVLGSELRACGVDFSFTPVLDLDHGGSSVIGDRAFHRDARVATRAREKRDARPAAGRHAELRQALSGTRLRQGRQPHRDSGRQAQPARDPRRRCASVRMAEHLAVERDAGARGLSEGRHAAGRVLAALAEGDPAPAARLHRRGLQRRPQHGRRAPDRRRRADLRRGRRAGARRRLRSGAAVQPVGRWRRRGRRAARRPARGAVARGRGSSTRTARRAGSTCCRRRRRSAGTT